MTQFQNAMHGLPLVAILRGLKPGEAPAIGAENTKGWRDAGAAGFGLGSSLYKPGDNAATVAEKAAAIFAAWKALA